MGLIDGSFTAIWQPVPKTLPARELLAYLCALISLVCGAGLFFTRFSALAARILLVYLMLWMLVFRVPAIFIAPASQDSWSGLGETAVIVAGAWVLYVWFADSWDKQRFGFANGDKGLRCARVFYALAMIPFGIAHFNYANETAGLVPGWVPLHVFWAYFFGWTFIAAGVAMLIGVFARLAAALSAVQMGMFTLLVWVPIIAAGSKDAFQWSETVLSFALTAAAWVIADSYRGISWTAINKR